MLHAMLQASVIFNNFLIFLVAVRSDNFSNEEEQGEEGVVILAGCYYIMCYVISFYVIFNYFLTFFEWIVHTFQEHI